MARSRIAPTDAPTLRGQPAFEAALVAFVEGCHRITNEDRRRTTPRLPEVLFGVDPRGRRFLRIWCGEDETRRRVHAFIDTTTGAIHKPAGWDAPAPIPRGNILDADHGLSCMSAYGPAYLR